jgi:hypothetical protein
MGEKYILNIKLSTCISHSVFLISYQRLGWSLGQVEVSVLSERVVTVRGSDHSDLDFLPNTLLALGLVEDYSLFYQGYNFLGAEF